MPTALERQGDFSQTTDNNGNPFPYIRIRALSGTCSATNHDRRCFASGGVLGRIPADRLYQTGLNILNMFPMPNIANVPAGQNYNYEIIRPNQTLLAWQPAIRVDYNATNALRTSFKYSGWQQRKETINGIDPRLQRHAMHKPVVSTWTVTANYNLNADDVPRGDVRAEPERADRLRAGSGRHRPERLPERVPDEPDGRSHSRPGSAGCRMLFPDAA